MELVKKYLVEIILLVLAVGVGAYFWAQDANKPEEPTPTLQTQQVQPEPDSETQQVQPAQ